MSEELKPCPFCGGEAGIKWADADMQSVGCINDSMLCPNPRILVYKKDGVFDYKWWNTRHIPEGCDLSPELKERIGRIAENARWCQDTVIDNLVEWLCKEGHQGSKFRSQVDRYKAMIAAAGK